MKTHMSGPYTKEDVKYVLQNWGKLPSEQIAKHLGRPKNALNYIADNIRKAGYPLPKNPKKEQLKLVINEALAELGLTSELGKGGK